METAVAFLQSLLRPDTGELKARATFHDQMTAMFDFDEIREICFDLAVPFDDLGGDTLSRKSLSLYEFMERRGDLYRLAAVCQEKRPDGNWTVT